MVVSLDVSVVLNTLGSSGTSTRKQITYSYMDIGLGANACSQISIISNEFKFIKVKINSSYLIIPLSYSFSYTVVNDHE